MIEFIREYLHATPFVPFLVHTSGGKQYRIATADHASINPTGTELAIWFDNGGGLMLTIAHMTSIEKESALKA